MNMSNKDDDDDAARLGLPAVCDLPSSTAGPDDRST